jgi:pimeloyl-ACP methyl ester carboxylesterase
MGKWLLATLVGLVVVLFSLPASAGAQDGDVAWGECPPPPPRTLLDPRQECALLSVPLDYSNPDGRQIELAISRIETSDPAQRRGIMLTNPGGPGSHGLYRPSLLAAVTPPEVQARYDFIGFDPRGIRLSSPVSCNLAATDLDVLKFIPYPEHDLDISENVAYARRAAAGCAAASGDQLPHNTTANTARDMDSIRAALGEDRISYAGYSYGSYLGAVYTALFPERTDRFILDSNIHPGKIWRETFASWGYAVEIAYDAFTRYAAERDDLYGLGDTPREVYELTLETAKELEREPFTYPGTTIVFTGDFFREFIRNDVLRNDLSFPAWADILGVIATRGGTEPAAAVSAGAHRLLAQAAEFPTPPHDNEFASPWAVVCGDADWPESPSTYQRDVRIFDRLFPIHGRAAANLWPCAFWPFDPEPAVEVDELEGSGRVLVMQSLRDPATPYDGGVAMRARLGQRSSLVSVENGVHVISFFGVNSCADAHAAAFMAEGTRPPRGAFCARDPEPEALGRDVREAVEEIRHADAGL